MSFNREQSGETPDTEFEQVLRNFRASVHVWSEAAYSRPRTAEVAMRRGSWRLAASCAFGCLLVAGTLTGGVHERHHRQQLARMAAAARQAQQRQLTAEQQAGQEENNLLATVDSDVSREIPSAMEPLAQLMDEDTNR